jgi:hypothetical protein
LKFSDSLTKSHSFINLTCAFTTSSLYGIANDSDFDSDNARYWSWLTHQHFDMFEQLSDILNYRSANLIEFSIIDSPCQVERITGRGAQEKETDCFGRSTMLKNWKRYASSLLITHRWICAVQKAWFTE